MWLIKICWKSSILVKFTDNHLTIISLDLDVKFTKIDDYKKISVTFKENDEEK